MTQITLSPIQGRNLKLNTDRIFVIGSADFGRICHERGLLTQSGAEAFLRQTSSETDDANLDTVPDDLDDAKPEKVPNDLVDATSGIVNHSRHYAPDRIVDLDLDGVVDVDRYIPSDAVLYTATALSIASRTVADDDLDSTASRD